MEIDSSDIATGIITAGVLAVITSVSRLINKIFSRPLRIFFEARGSSGVAVKVVNVTRHPVQMRSIVITTGRATAGIRIPEIRGRFQDTLDDGASHEFILSDCGTPYAKMFDVPSRTVVTLHDGRKIMSAPVVLREVVNEGAAARK